MKLPSPRAARPEIDTLTGELAFLEVLLKRRPAVTTIVLRRLGEIGDDARVDMARLRAERMVRLDREARERLRNRRSPMMAVAAAMAVIATAPSLVLGGPALATPVEPAPEVRDAALRPLVVHVMDVSSGKPLAGVRIQTVAEEIVAVTDESGQATVPGQFATENLLSLEHEGYPIVLVEGSKLASRSLVTMKHFSSAALATRALEVGRFPGAMPAAPKLATQAKPTRLAATTPIRVVPAGAGPKVALANDGLPILPPPSTTASNSEMSSAVAAQLVALGQNPDLGGGGGNLAAVPIVESTATPIEPAVGPVMMAAAPPVVSIRMPKPPKVRAHSGPAARNLFGGAVEPVLPSRPNPMGNPVIAELGADLAPTLPVRPKPDPLQFAWQPIAQTPVAAVVKRVVQVPITLPTRPRFPKAAALVAQIPDLPLPVIHLPTAPKFARAAEPALARATAPVVRLAATATRRGWGYRVREGDMLSSIARRELGSASLWPLLYAANRDLLTNPRWLQIGLTLQIPRTAAALARAGGTMYTVKQGDSLWRIASDQLGNWKLWSKIYAANRNLVKDPSVIYPGQRLLLPGKAQLADASGVPAAFANLRASAAPPSDMAGGGGGPVGDGEKPVLGRH